MQKYYWLSLLCCVASCVSTPSAAQTEVLEPLVQRVNVQAELASPDKIIDGEWVGVGTSSAHAIQRDHALKYRSKPSYRFELKFLSSHHLVGDSLVYREF